MTKLSDLKKKYKGLNICECSHTNEEHKDLGDNYAPCSIMDCSCDDYNTMENYIVELETLNQTERKHIALIEQHLLYDNILYMRTSSLSKYANSHTDCSLEDTGKKYLGLMRDGDFFQWVTFDDVKGEYDFTYSQPTTIDQQLDEPLAKYFWRYSKMEELVN
jgi:hypothetical protein